MKQYSDRYYHKRNAELCQMIQSGDLSAQEELLELNDGYLRTYLNWVMEHHFLSSMYTYNDALQDCRIAILESAKTFNPSKGKFSTHVRWAFQTAISKGWVAKYPIHIPSSELMALHAGKPMDKRIVERIGSIVNSIDIEETVYSEEAAGYMDEITCGDMEPADPVVFTPDIRMTVRMDVRAAKLEIFKCIKKLPQKERICVIMAFNFDCPEVPVSFTGISEGTYRSYADIAKEIDMSVISVKKTLDHALRSLWLSLYRKGLNQFDFHTGQYDDVNLSLRRAYAEILEEDLSDVREHYYDYRTDLPIMYRDATSREADVFNRQIDLYGDISLTQSKLNRLHGIQKKQQKDAV